MKCFETKYPETKILNKNLVSISFTLRFLLFRGYTINEFLPYLFSNSYLIISYNICFRILKVRKNHSDQYFVAPQPFSLGILNLNNINSVCCRFI